MTRLYPDRFVAPISKYLSSFSKAAQALSRNQGLKLLLNSGLTRGTHPHPDVYPFAAYLGKLFECPHVITIGSPTARELLQLHPQFEITGLVPAADLESYRQRYGFATWLGVDFNDACRILREDIPSRAIVVCTAVIEQLASPASFLQDLKRWLDVAPACILTTTDRSLDQGRDDQAFRAHAAHPGRWNMVELERLLLAEGFNLEFIGLTASDDVSYEKRTILALLTNGAAITRRSVNTPADFRVVAFMAAYNEEDIIVQSIKKWTEQGVHVHILENWSTDATYDLAKQLEGRLPVTVERFPREGPSRYFEWGAMLKRIEALSRQIEADWFVRRGADEVLVPPWPGMSYRDGLYFVDRAGFNCVDHTVIEFQPVDDGFKAGMDHESYFKYFAVGKVPACFRQKKAWKNYGRPVSMAPSGGHDLPFEGQRVYPYKFLLKHYPVRSQRHGEKKVFQERKPRWNPMERARGWHRQYDSIRKGHQFLRPVLERQLFDEDDFNKTYLVERLSGIGILR